MVCSCCAYDCIAMDIKSGAKIMRDLVIKFYRFPQMARVYIESTFLIITIFQSYTAITLPSHMAPVGSKRNQVGVRQVHLRHHYCTFARKGPEESDKVYLK